MKNIGTLVITGANGIIGSAVCKKALEQGYQVAALEIDFDNLGELQADYKDHLLCIACDLRESEQLKLAKQAILDKWNSIDGLFNNAAWKGNDINEFFNSFEDYTLETWRNILSVNLDAVMLVDQVFGSHMAHVQGYGSIVHTASIYGICAPDQKIYDGSLYLGNKINTPAVYSASKGAIIALSQYLCSYWNEKNVRVNCISPGGVASGQNKTFEEKYSNKVPLGRMAQATEIAEAVLFLLSRKSSYINGHNLIVDGGFTSW